MDNLKIDQIHPKDKKHGLKEDVIDELDCFGEFDKNDRICTRYCGVSIMCAIERTQNPKMDIFDHIVEMDFYILQ
ncbi:MAG: hypothetical protein U9P10_02435 [Thermodesulfobacteriota bacterium]|nr:hypothetical protein [Thermodesulfobacteriota bacterium]